MQCSAESEAQSVPAPGSAPSTSSLEAFQRGESTATPASSPLKEVYFDFDRYDLRADARETLKANGDWLKANPSAVVEIEGHCDERGTNEYNMALGAKRAQAAMDYLTTLGVAANRLSTIRYGEELLVCEERTEDAGKKSSRPLRDSAYTACLLASFSRQRMPAKQANLVLKAT